MVPASGRNRAPLSQQLLDEAYRFDFFQAVRVIQRMAQERCLADTGPRQVSVGHDLAPKQEAVRFRAMPSHSFPTGAISRLRQPKRAQPDDTPHQAPPEGPSEAGQQPEVVRGPLEMIVAFMGLTGPSGVLPQHYTSLLIRRVREKDYALRDFLDLFNHRTISLFYRAWEKYRFPIGYERSQLAPGQREEDLFTHVLYCLLGLGTGGLRNRLEFDDEAFLFYAGHFSHHPRSAVSLETMLCDYFELPVGVKQFQGQWLRLSQHDQSSLPCPKHPQGRNMKLGANVVVGERVWEVGSKFRVRLGPLSYWQFCRFVPSGDALRPLAQMVRSYVGPHLDFDVQPVLEASEVPWCRLGGDGVVPSSLGWNTWIRSDPFQSDVDDAVFFLEG